MKHLLFLLLAAALLACNGGRTTSEDAVVTDTAGADPYAEARALFEARQQMRQRAEGDS